MRTHPNDYTRHAPFLKLAQMAFVALIMSLAGLSFAGAASASPTGVIGTPAGYGNGYNDVIGSVGVYNHLMVIGSSKVYVYCLVQSEGYQSSGEYHASGSASVTNLDAALDIAANSSHIGTPLTDPNEEAVAVQIAIWNETGNFNISQVNNSTIDARAEALVAGAGSLAPYQAVGSYTLSITQTRHIGGSIVRVHLSGTKASGADVTLSIAGRARTYRVSSAGTLSLNVSGRKLVRATYTEILPPGTIMAPTTTADQPLVTADSASITTTADLITRPLVRHVAPTTRPPTHATTTLHHRVTPTTIRVITPTTLHHRVAPTTTTTRKVVPTTTTTKATSSAVCTTLGLTWKSWQVLLGGLLLLLLGIVIGSLFRRSDREYE